MKYLILLFALMAPALSAQYWIGLENDTTYTVDSLEFFDINTSQSTGNVLTADISPGGDYTYSSLVGGQYLMVATSPGGELWQTDLSVPTGTTGGLVTKLSWFTLTLPTLPNARPTSDPKDEAGCVATKTNRGRLGAMLAIAMVAVLASRRRAA